MRTLPVLGIILTWPLFAQADITYTKDIAPIIQENCAGCHRPGEAAPFALRDYEEVRRRARMIRRTVSDKIMPPWHAIGGDVPIVGDRQLSEEQITLIEKWVDAGLPEGDPADLPEPKEFPDGWKLGTPDLVLEMEESYQLYAEGPDVYRNFVLPTGLKEQRWLKAIEFHPGNPEIVHHTLFYLDTTGSARRTDAADPEPGFAEMPFGEGVGKSLGGWAPGMMPVPLPDGLAFSLPAGGDIILSTHFHPSGKAESERSTIGLYFSDEPPKREFLVIQLPPIFGAFAGVDIPPGERDKTITDTFELPVDVEAFGAVGHAHYLGRSLRMEATFPDGSSKVMLNIPKWDFSWQEEYRFTEMVKLPKGTRLTSTVTWDNTEENPFNPTYPPVRVRWGFESEDEMGSVSLLVTATSPGDHRELRRAYSDHLRWQVGGHLVSDGKLSFAEKLRKNAIKKFDTDGDGVLSVGERERAKQFLEGTRSPVLD